MWLNAITLCACIAKGAFAAAIVCKTESQPNPISAEYPNDATGTINGTTAIVPIPYDIARQIVPSQYRILTHAYESLIPSLPKGTYPALLTAVLDHDVGQGAAKIGDFQMADGFSKRIALSYPFIDRLNDNYTSFKFTAPQLISFNPVALTGSALYGSTTLGYFDPYCNPYKAVAKDNSETQSTVYDATKVGQYTAFKNQFKTAGTDFPYNIAIFKNLTNQPSFGTSLPVCDNYITLFNSTVTQGQYLPVPVKGTVKVRKPYYASDTTFDNVWGYRMDNAFVERNFKDCQSLQGYKGTGPGDS